MNSKIAFSQQFEAEILTIVSTVMYQSVVLLSHVFNEIMEYIIKCITWHTLAGVAESV